MAKIVSSYCTKVIGENRIFKDTIRVYRDALSLLIRIVESEWDTGLGELYAKSTLKAQRTVELLVHASRTSVAKYPEFDKQFYKYPSYLRRSTISEALGAVSSYRAAVSHWESAGRKGKEPKLQTSRSAMPTFYKDNMYEDNGDGTARLKLYHKNDWVWVKVRLRKQDIDYIREHWDKADASAPKLVKRDRRYALCFAFEETVAYGTKPLTDQTILAVDLGINTDAVCSVMRPDGTVLARKFIDFPSEKDRLNTQLGRARRGQRENGHRGGNRHMKKAVRINEDLSKKIAPAIVRYAVSVGADIIVMEHLDFIGQKPKHKKHRLHMWRNRDIQKIVMHQAHRNGIRVRFVNARNTSRLAFDGSGEVARNSTNMALCRFQNGKQYNCDLNASYNIGARYFIREYLKPIPETEWSLIMAKVPELERRTNCTLSTLFSLYAVLNCQTVSVSESWPHGGNESGA
jgi:IS605 OrfB family transposase